MKGDATGLIFRTRAEEVLDRRASLAAADPLIARAELELRKSWLGLSAWIGQLPYEPLVRLQPHADAVVRAKSGLRRTFIGGAVAQVVRRSKTAERTLKRRFKRRTGLTPIAYRRLFSGATAFSRP